MGYPQGPPPQASPPAANYSQDELKEIITQALAAQKAEHDALIAEISAKHDASIGALSGQVAGLQQMLSGSVPHVIPEHAGGPGNEIRPTWSAYEQAREIAKREAALAGSS